MARQGRDRFGLARFGEPALLILSSLLDGPKHGYAITQDVEAMAGVRLGPGTLYGALSKLEERGLIVALPSTDRRQPYELTADGRTAVSEHIQMWNRVVQTTTGRLRAT